MFIHFFLYFETEGVECKAYTIHLDSQPK